MHSEYQGTIIRPCDKKDTSQPQRGIIRIDGIIVGDRKGIFEYFKFFEEKKRTLINPCWKSLMPDIHERIEYNERDRSQHSFTLIGTVSSL